ncbi:hypothetical protein ACTMTF_06810 [Nonomuraea sp. ZG12]
METNRLGRSSVEVTRLGFGGGPMGGYGIGHSERRIGASLRD